MAAKDEELRMAMMKIDIKINFLDFILILSPMSTTLCASPIVKIESFQLIHANTATGSQA